MYNHEGCNYVNIMDVSCCKDRSDMEFCTSARALLMEEFCQTVEGIVKFLKTRLWK